MPVSVASPCRPAELADIFRTYGHLLTGLSPQQWRVVAAISSCRTAALGGHVRECDHGCGHVEIYYNSCRDRHCPKCQRLERVRWQEEQAAMLLPVPYFHLVFTVPGSLHEVFLAYPKLAYGLLFQAVAATLREVADNPKNLGARIGATAVLHTWTQSLLYHPHIHCIVPGGGIDPTGMRWVPTRQGFFLPVRVLSTVFRGKLLAAIEKAVAAGKMNSTVNNHEIPRLLRRAASKKWVVYCKSPFAGPEQVLRYLGRYSHRVAIGNERILAMDGGEVTFSFKDRTDGDRRKTTSLPAEDFLRRFLLHVLPPGFVRIRHYGLLANSLRRDTIALARKLLGAPPDPPIAPPSESWEELLLRLTGRDVTRCPACGKGRLVMIRQVPPAPTARPPIQRKGFSP